jgi:hypothetical protein
MAGAIAPDSSPCDALVDSVLQGPLRLVTRPQSAGRAAALREAAIALTLNQVLFFTHEARKQGKHTQAR